MVNSLPEESRDLAISDFDYDLPEVLIAQHPLEDRTASRLMVVHPGNPLVHHSSMRELADWLRPGDLLVANDSRVLPARLHGAKRETGGKVELLLLAEQGPGCWTAMAKPARSLRPGTCVTLSPREAGTPAVDLTVVEQRGEGIFLIAFEGGQTPDLDAFGVMPLPPYIAAPLSDPARYQTTYADRIGSAAAPTAGLHFTPDLIADLQRQGIGWETVTLHVGLDTFRPVMVDNVRDHRMHAEWCEVSDQVAAAIARTRSSGGRVIAVGTTAARTLETLGQQFSDRSPQGITTDTSIFITPGYRWRLVDGLLTNFHLPKSTLLMMVSALAGRETIRSAYAAAVTSGYRFFSFGDAMLIIPEEVRP